MFTQPMLQPPFFDPDRAFRDPVKPESRVLLPVAGSRPNKAWTKQIWAALATVGERLRHALVAVTLLLLPNFLRRRRSQAG